MSKRGICELCGFADDSYSIEENGTVMKVCKFCHDGYMERMGLSPDADNPVDDVTLTLDLDSAEDSADVEENLQMRVEPLTEEELNKVLNGNKFKRRKTEMKIETEVKPAVTAQVQQKADEQKPKRFKRDIMDDVNPKIDDERISITSPEIALSKDLRPKTNLDVAVNEYKNSVKFLDAFKYVFNPITYAVFLGVIVLAVSTVLFIISDWSIALIALGTGIAAVALSYFVMWYLRIAYDTDKRAYLLRIRQQEILFNSMNSDCYRELKTKYSVLKALSWLLNKLSVLLPLLITVSCAVAAVILTFLYLPWLFAIVLFASIIAGVIVYWVVKLLADIVTYALDKEKNQQIMEQTMLDVLKQLKK